jgi:hypothetical protein
MLKCVQRRVLAGLLVSQLLIQPLLADEAVEIRDIEGCRTIVADSERLLCYDTVVDGGVFNRQQVQKENFGTSNSQPESSVDKLLVTIVLVQKSSSGVHYFHTADEQVWRQVNRGNWSLEVPIQAEIKAGMMGSYFLVTEGGKSVRVKRVK